MTQSDRISVLLVDDRPVLTTGLKLLIGTAEGLELAGEPVAPEQAMTAATRRRPDVVLLQVDLRREEELFLVSRLSSVCPRSRVLVLTDTTDAGHHQAAAFAGAQGLVTRDRSPALLLKAIRKVHAGELWFDQRLLGSILEQAVSGICAGTRGAMVPERS